MKDALVTTIIVIIMASAAVFAGYEWGQSSVRIHERVTIQTYPVTVTVPGKAGELKIKYRYDTTVVHDTTIVFFNGTVDSWHDPFLIDSSRISNWIWTAADTNLTLWGNTDSISYYIRPQKKDTILAKSDTSSYIEATSHWYDHWYYIPVGAALYITAEKLLWKK